MIEITEELLYKARRFIDEATGRGVMVVTAESCTGGLIAGLLTEIAGSSAVVDRGFVTYSNEAKHELLAVPDELLASHGAVSTEVASAMASGALSAAPASKLSVAVTGIAGPGGGSPEKPVGLVYIATGQRLGTGVVTQEKRFEFGDIGRREVRLATVSAAMDLLQEALSDL